MRADDQTTSSPGLAILKNLVFVLLLVGIENVLIFSGAGFPTSGTSGGAFIGPIPGSVIGGVWTVLFAGLGVVRGIMDADGSPAARRASFAVLVLLIACAAYPFYTLGLRSDLVGFFGDIATLCLAVWVAVRVGAVSRFGLAAPLAVIGWLIFAGAILVDEGHAFR